eukprot:TRINITY_DN21696_c0_g1_i2.p1 TRINITY_DN21696_c0_g1~~TRINITY_DN21696_c0_g1_i2.p1  ORF type:complete len:390 (-),score=28.95 TRINITY_DN21696_c0_g1_i2:198-1367(-)
MMARSSLLLLVAHLPIAQPGRMKHVNSFMVAKGGLENNLVLLHGGTAQEVLDVLREGIPTSGEDQKLGPGLYTTVYRHDSQDWTRSLHNESWRDKVWGAKHSASISESELPYVLALTLADDARFAVTPHSLWYGSADKWSGDPRRNRCLYDYDGMFVAPRNRADVMDKQSKTCSALQAIMEDESVTECKAVSTKALIRLVDAGCVQEFKVNPGRESMTQLRRVAYNNHRASLRDSIELEGQLGTTDEVTMKSWLCPHVLAQGHEANSLVQKMFTTRHAFKACGHALHAWERGICRRRCGAPCDETNSALDRRVESLALSMPAGDPRIAQLNASWWEQLGSQDARREVRKMKSHLIRDAACNQFHQEVSQMKESVRTAGFVYRYSPRRGD